MPVRDFLLSCVLALVATGLYGTPNSRAAGPLVVAEGEGKQAPHQPQAACGGDGTIHLAYGIGDDVYYSRSTDGGQSFQPATTVGRCLNLALGRRRGPRIAAIDGSVVITAIGGPQGKGNDGDLQSWRLGDTGGGWSGPVLVNDVPAAAREGLHGMAAGPDGSLWCTWLDLRTKQMEIYAARSTDGGATWGPNRLVYRSPDGNICTCCHPSIAIDHAGRVLILFRNTLGADRDMYLTESTDGEHFSPARKLGTGTWRIDHCPMDGGMLAVDDAGHVQTVWRRDTHLFLASDGESESPLGPGEQPWITAGAGGPVMVWVSRRDGDLWALRPGDSQPLKLAGDARDPVVVAAPGSHHVVVAWEGRTENGSAIHTARIAGE